MPRVLIVEDEPQIVEAVEKAFSLEPAFTLKPAPDPEKALEAAVRGKPDLILLDIRLSGSDGRGILKQLKSNAATRRIPVIFLTGLSSEGDRVLGLNLGADDYIVKPFGAMELLARIKAVLRRYSPAPSDSEALSLGDLTLDPQNRAAELRGKPLRLQPKEFEVLYLLASHPGRSMPRSYLIENSSSYGMEISTRSLDTHVKNLRKKLGPCARWIETVPKLGYRFAPSALPRHALGTAPRRTTSR